MQHRVWKIAGALEFRVCQPIRLPGVAHRQNERASNARIMVQVAPGA
jgi:hypothetical protein